MKKIVLSKASSVASAVASNISAQSTPVMEKIQSRAVAPFASILIFVGCLFCVVFCKMEVRRMGYSVLKLSREERQMRDQERVQSLQLAKITRPERVQAVAQQKLTLKKPESGQIIQMTEQGVAFRQ